MERRACQRKAKKNFAKCFGWRCLVTGITDRNLLKGSHIKDFAFCTPAEAVSAYNGILLSAQLDDFFNQKLISFDNNGDLIKSPLLSESHLKTFNIKYPYNYGAFPPGFHANLAWHRAALEEKVLKENKKKAKKKAKNS